MTKMGFFKKEQEVQANTLCLEEPTMVEIKNDKNR
jgi:hypothetical protein